jgi:small neutral amino acid transporter SnatA (MarC family)
MSTLLLVITFVAAVNPARIHPALPAAGTWRARVAVTALGAALVLVVLVGLAAVANSLLDALDIDEASFRIAAGLVLLVAGGRDLLLRPPAAEPALAGWRAALVPVAIPLLFRPEIAVLAIAAGADDGLAATAGAAVSAFALTVISARAPSELSQSAMRARDWLARLTATVLVVTAVDLAVDGILAV